MKMAIFIKENALRPVENHDMESQKQLGAMRQKMANFKRETAFAGVQMFFQELSFYIQKEMNSWGRCVRKWRFSNRETAFAGGTFFPQDIFFGSVGFAFSPFNSAETFSNFHSKFLNDFSTYRCAQREKCFNISFKFLNDFSHIQARAARKFIYRLAQRGKCFNVSLTFLNEFL